jgi:SAM-dependent MidA family methyltransferase
VNFTALSAAARESGIEPLALVTQSQFLVGIGEDTQFADAFQECRLPQEQTKRALQLKHLITPEGMGEAFHVLVMSSRLEKEKAAQLSGLKFVRESDWI